MLSIRVKSLTMRHFSEAFVFLRQLIQKISKQIIKMVLLSIELPKRKEAILDLKSRSNQLS